MKNGYHSDIHQLNVSKYCFLHPKQKLIEDYTQKYYVGHKDKANGHIPFFGLNDNVERTIKSRKIKKEIYKFMEQFDRLEYICFIDSKYGNEVKNIYQSSNRLLSNLLRNNIKSRKSSELILSIDDDNHEGFNMELPNKSDNDIISSMVKQLNLEILNNEFKGDKNEYFKCAGELTNIEGLYELRKLKRVEQYASLLIFYSFLQSNEPNYFNELRNAWYKYRSCIANTSNLLYDLTYLNLNYQDIANDISCSDNDSNSIKYRILIDAYEKGKISLIKYFKKNKNSLFNKDILYEELYIEMPQYFIVRIENKWQIYSCI
jgi:hypothetical protein